MAYAFDSTRQCETPDTFQRLSVRLGALLWESRENRTCLFWIDTRLHRPTLPALIVHRLSQQQPLLSPSFPVLRFEHTSGIVDYSDTENQWHRAGNNYNQALPASTWVNLPISSPKVSARLCRLPRRDLGRFRAMTLLSYPRVRSSVLVYQPMKSNRARCYQSIKISKHASMLCERRTSPFSSASRVIFVSCLSSCVADSLN